jgi:hypothetical protein
MPGSMCNCQGTVCQCRPIGIWETPRYTSNIPFASHPRCDCHECTQARFRMNPNFGIGLGDRQFQGNS